MKTVKKFIQRFKAGGWLFNSYVGFVFVRFSVSLVNDLLWYAGVLRKASVALPLALLLWALWIFRPWVETNEESER